MTRTRAARDREVAEVVAQYEERFRVAMPKILRGTRGGVKEKKALAAHRRRVLAKYPLESGRLRSLLDKAYQRVYNARRPNRRTRKGAGALLRHRARARARKEEKKKHRKSSTHRYRKRILAEKIAIANQPRVEGEDRVIGPEQADAFAQDLLGKKVAQLDEKADVPADWTLRDLLLNRTVYIGYTRRPVNMEALQWIGRVVKRVPVFDSSGTFTGDYENLPEHMHGFPLLSWGTEAPPPHAQGDHITPKPAREVLKFKTLQVCSFQGANAKLSARTVEAKLQELFHDLPPGRRCWKQVDMGALRDEQADKGCKHKVYVDFSAEVLDLISKGVVEVNSR